jgi:hypothetical protein
MRKSAPAVTASRAGSGNIGRSTNPVVNDPAIDPAVAAALMSPARRPTEPRLSVSALTR